jgi:hypothetical protein
MICMIYLTMAGLSAGFTIGGGAGLSRKGLPVPGLYPGDGATRNPFLSAYLLVATVLLAVFAAADSAI